MQNRPTGRKPALNTDETSTPDDERHAAGPSRRAFLKTGAVLGASAGPLMFAQPTPAEAAEVETLQHLNSDRGRRLLIRGGCVLTMDPAIGDFLRADVLIHGKEIVAVGRDLGAAGQGCQVIDAHGMIVLPGLIDTHRHCWQNYFRRAIPNAQYLVDYSAFTHRGFAPYVRPRDHFVGNLVSGLGAIFSGVTCVLDYSHNSRTRAHVDAAIRAHFHSGLRAVFAYGPVSFGEWDMQWPQDIRRVKAQFFSSDDQLPSLRLATGAIPENYRLARDVGVAITTDGAIGPPNPTFLPLFEELARQGLLGPDVTLIHGTAFPDSAFQLMKDNGVKLSLAPTSDAHYRGLGDSIVPIQKALDFGLDAGLSVDVEVSLSPDLFSQMKDAFYVQRMLSNKRWADGDASAPPPMTVQQVLHMATVGGAKCNGVEDKVGSLTPGKEADIIMIAAEDIMNMPLNNAYGTVVLGADVSSVRNVLIAGRIRKWKGRLVGVDIDRVRRLVHQSRDYVARASGLWEPGNILDEGPLYPSPEPPPVPSAA